MSEKLYGICENKCLKEVLSKEEVETKLANYKLKGDFAIISGSLTLADGKANGSIDYPSGFNGSNCVVLSFMAHKSDVSNIAGYGYLETSVGYQTGAIGHSVSLTSDKINININNPTDGAHTSGAGTYTYKVILMKV